MEERTGVGAIPAIGAERALRQRRIAIVGLNPDDPAVINYVLSV